MALNVDTQDLENYPGTTKRVTVDQDSIVPVGFDGDEQFVIKVSTSAYSDNTSRTAIQDMYITDFKCGWCKSSGFTGTGGKFDVDSTHYRLAVKIDNCTTTSGSDTGQTGYYDINLAYNQDDTPITGEAIADDMQTKIRALNLHTADTGYELSYTNATVEYINGKFKVVSGSMSGYFTGTNRSSVKVINTTYSGCANQLGFNLPIDSETLAGFSVKEAAISQNYTADSTPLYISAGTGVAAGDALMIKDGVNVDYFTAISGTTDTAVVVPTMSVHNHTGISHNYTTTSGARVQILREQDPEAGPAIHHDDVDAVVRFGVMSMVNQIDYSS